MIAYLAADLIWATRIKSAAEGMGVSARPVRSLEMLEARLADSPVRGLIVDLDAPPEVAMALIRRAKEAGLRTVAFGPHVATDLLEEAARAGATTVLPRGAFAAKMGEIMRGLEGGTPSGEG